jgi:hypothetical protein
MSAAAVASADLLPKAVDCKKRLAEIEGEKASEHVRVEAAKAAERQALLDQFTKPSGVPEDERMQRAAAIIKRAVESGLTEVEVGRFPVQLCTDGGRAINQQEKGWETTLTGLPKELYTFWKSHLQARGYKLRSQIATWPGGMPGEIGLILAWD